LVGDYSKQRAHLLHRCGEEGVERREGGYNARFLVRIRQRQGTQLGCG
jgi:hypothetical protein